MAHKYFYLLLLISNLLYGQVNEDFSDGDFTNNPKWSGDATHFEVNSSGQLHLKSSGSDTSYLSTESLWITNAEWRFWVKHSFNSSDNNNSRVYIVSDKEDLEKNLNGYFVQIGSGNDNIEFYRQTGANITRIIEGSISYTGNSVNQIRIKVIRDDAGNWSLFCDDEGGENYFKEGEGFDDTNSNNEFMGIFCKYTSSNATKFYFDDFYAGPIIVDTIPPEILSLNVVSINELEINFTEGLDINSAEITSNYFVDNGVGVPLEVILNTYDLSSIKLKFAVNFTNGVLNKIRICNISDLAGNILVEEYKEFSYYEVKAFDVVINEIMADPDPPRELPVAEYIELYNTTTLPINLNGWIIEFGSSSKFFPGITIPPKAYMIICGNTILSYYGQVADILTSSSSLSNEGTTITLKNNTKQIISTVSYDASWYDDNYKEEGGWSLEQIDPDNPCGGKTNWTASVDMEGGTPGRKNSVDASNPDYESPYLSRVGVINNTSIQVHFNEPLDSLRLKEKSNFSIDNGISISDNISAAGPDYQSVILELNDSIMPGIIYYLSISDTITDCVGNIVPLNSSARFALPMLAEYQDIVINEILFNPKDFIVTGKDFVEIYNRSDKVFDMKDILISSVDPSTMIPSSAAVSEESYLLFPHEYLVMTKDDETVKTQYYTTNPEGFLEVESLPNYNNDEGIVELSLGSGIIIDRYAYNEDMHFDLLNTTDGISLERVNPDSPTEETTNWHSASEASGFATPAYENSMFSNFEAENSKIEISPKIFSPEDSYGNHLLNICYKLSEAGFIGNVTIHNSNGMLIKQLKNNELLGTKGCFTWDGLNYDGRKAPIGIYIILFEIFNLDGKVERVKEVCVLGGKI